METQWLEYLRERAGNSVYQGEGFWDSLSGEEKICAEAVLGLLEDIRGDEEERAELAWIGFWYLIYKGFQETYCFFKNIPPTTFQVLCQRAGEKKRERCMGISYLCMEFLFAEELGGADREKWDVSPFVRLYENLSKDVGELSGK